MTFLKTCHMNRNLDKPCKTKRGEEGREGFGYASLCVYNIYIYIYMYFLGSRYEHDDHVLVPSISCSLFCANCMLVGIAVIALAPLDSVLYLHYSSKYLFT